MTSDSILKNANDEQLALAVFENLYGLFRIMAKTIPDGQLVETERLSQQFPRRAARG